jgi:hypothetical protein
MEESDFLAAVACQADCDILLDVNNVYVNARNHSFDPVRYRAAVPAERVRQFHLAGNEDHGHVVIDTQDQPVCDRVWDLYRQAVARFGPVLLALLEALVLGVETIVGLGYRFVPHPSRSASRIARPAGVSRPGAHVSDTLSRP